ncbi:YggS family pyridoxal phosphate-dependent enzyme [candidate division KSB3 bacterium]|uniref:Pyridoxal phosphate homeostasis protein n=1 Tax=candidate division KSB3 bacterium TaxID=2044937 RepID=A0A2G6E4U7_9BACT|nr:MAG: YggS family pyridoxal phosphate-dependent enzyme [candidate division KSB3 bacterium]PIE29405.1 MAG: YggS family pyridoxal phosphate-dependent enzyme [candidate division KSB3 bacterium]
MSIRENYQRIRGEVPDHVTIVLAAKTRSVEEVLEAIDAGAEHIGENYVQEAEKMLTALGERARELEWHLIGSLQKNKINKALSIFDLFQTVDSLDSAKAIDARAARIAKVVPIYVEVNIGSEDSKSGMPPEYDAIERLVREIARLDNVRLEGLMTMGVFSPDPEESRPYFRQARKIYDRLALLDIPNVSLKTLSMGMSDSYQVAIEEGASMIRLGTIVFGKRQYR